MLGRDALDPDAGFEKIKALCPECGGPMSEKMAFKLLIARCHDCRYVVSVDFVSGFWAGIRRMEKESAKWLRRLREMDAA